MPWPAPRMRAGSDRAGGWIAEWPTATNPAADSPAKRRWSRSILRTMDEHAIIDSIRVERDHRGEPYRA